MKKKDYFLSYLYPITVETTSSRWNPVLEIMLYAGKYSLNSENTNYSFGSLHTLSIRTFRRLKLNWDEINSVLILGFGTGSVASIINKYKNDCTIEGVEIDEKVLELGEKYFDTCRIKNTTIHCVSTERFVGTCKKQFDLIVIDIYLDLRVPETIQNERFITGIKSILNTGGVVIFNKFIFSKESREQFKLLKSLYGKIFGNLKIMTVMFTGKIFITKKLS
jgi:spermidine synthase